MPKKPITREQLRREPLRDWNGYTRDEVVAAVCKYFCRGHTAFDISEIVKAKLGITLTREDPYRLLSHAGTRGWLEFHAPEAYDLSAQIQKTYSWLQKVAVLRTAVSDDISNHVAKMLLDLVCQFCRTHSPDIPVHVGFAGGTSLRKTARRFAEMLREPQEDLPETIIFHAMVAGFDFNATMADPNVFFSYFVGEPTLQVKTGMVGLHVPGLVKTAQVAELRSLDHIRQAYEAVRDLHIIVTSAGGHWKEGHSALYDMYKNESPRALRRLNTAGCVGDMMWRPLGSGGPLELRTDVRTMTLMELSELPGFIKRGGSVLLLLGACGSCGGPKTEVLRAILHSKQRLITHLVSDSRSVRGVIGADQ